jgi:hypothetical protein
LVLQVGRKLGVPEGNAVPEPSSLAVLLAGLAAAGCAFYLTRKKPMTA